MKQFFRACKNRPLFLWILFFIWLAVCTSLCVFLFHATHDPLSFSIYLLLPFPLSHLMLFEKPMDVCDDIVIFFTYLGIFNIIARFIWQTIPIYITFACLAVCVTVIVGVTFWKTRS